MGLQQYPFFRSAIDEAAREDSGLHQGQVVVDIGMEFSKGPMSSIRSPTGLSVVQAQVPMPEELSSRAQQSIFPSRRTSCLSNLRRGC